MKTIATLATLIFVLTGSLMAGDKTTEGAEISKTAVVESGTYQGKAHKVDPGEKEIYVKTADGKILELYLKSDTALTQGGKKVEFDALKEGQDLEVKVEKEGKKLKPISVNIVE
ncbi:hypothetical protein EI77_04441 [Prosthecobacter fusiformis]|uniref:Uncharacterized protein n=1 Tax=Prosthecobacter fusiformis TaxID=48464 RepID=A0A4R7RKE6_9BACT|nr:hypothetical protein [Prosthecobacter fusiformis]TDU63232.1 hypothetical protein EI77_04441 [Prosthecobacter fusiformis]